MNPIGRISRKDRTKKGLGSLRRGDREAEGAALEMPCTVTRTEGSNPSLSAVERTPGGRPFGRRRAVAAGRAPGRGQDSLPSFPAAHGRIIAARVPRVASREPAQALRQPAEQPVFPQALDHVSAAARLEAAGVAQHRAERALVDPDQPEQQADRQALGPSQHVAQRTGAIMAEPPAAYGLRPLIRRSRARASSGQRSPDLGEPRAPDAAARRSGRARPAARPWTGGTPRGSAA